MMDLVNETENNPETLTHKIQELSKGLKPRDIARELGVSANEVRVIRSRLKKQGKLPARTPSFEEDFVKKKGYDAYQKPYQIKKIQRMMAARKATNPKLMELVDRLCHAGFYTGLTRHERIAYLPPEAQQYLIDHPEKIRDVMQGKIILRLE